jgi:hypothetical protein
MRAPLVSWLILSLACDADRSPAARDPPSDAAQPTAMIDASIPPPPPPSPAAWPPIDRAALAAEVAARLADAGTARTHVEEGTFVFVAPDSGIFFDGAMSLAHRSLVALQNGRFPRLPSRAVTVVAFSDPSAYSAYCLRQLQVSCTHALGLYRHGQRQITLLLTGGMTTLTHEIVHPLVEADFPMAPTWFDEGIASLFEQPVFPQPGEIHGVANGRRQLLLPALDAGLPTARIDSLFGMSTETFLDAGPDLHYALARELCRWLDDQHLLWPFYRAWRDGFWDDLTGEKAFKQVVGKTPGEANPAWALWVRGG